MFILSISFIILPTKVVILIENKIDLQYEKKLIVAKVKKILNIKNGIINNLLDKKISEKELSFYISLILRCDYSEKGYTDQVKTLALVTQVIYLATKTHSLVYEKTGKKENFKEEVQMPILIGDLLYAVIYDILCKEDFLLFLDDILEYVSNLSLAWISFFENNITKEELCKIWYGDLGVMAMKLLPKLNEEENAFVNRKEIGLLFGNLFGAKNLMLPNETIDKYYKDLKNALMKINDPIKRELLEEYLNEMHV